MLKKIRWDICISIIAISLAIYGVITSENTIAKAVRPKAEVTHTRYTAYGRYYTDGTIITTDGNEWGYNTDTISDRPTYDAMPIWVAFDDNGTPTDITDDIVLGAVFDRNTAIYDALETSLSEKFELERDGNNIKINNLR